jgi:hypothetical protein
MKTVDHMIALTTNSQGTLAAVSFQSSHFDNEVEAYLVSKDDKSERYMFISQLTLYDENQERLPRNSNILEFWLLSPLTKFTNSLSRNIKCGTYFVEKLKIGNPGTIMCFT